MLVDHEKYFESRSSFSAIEPLLSRIMCAFDPPELSWDNKKLSRLLSSLATAPEEIGKLA